MNLVKTNCPIPAYIDPGAGSMMLQVLLGGSAAVLVLLKLTWRRLLGYFGLFHPNSSAAHETSPRS
jgi:hypothetical protein